MHGNFHVWKLSNKDMSGNVQKSIFPTHGEDITIQPLIASRSSVLHAGIMSNEQSIVQLLLNAGAEIHLYTQDNSGQTPLHIAVEMQDVRTARYLLDKGASPDTQDLGEVTPLQLAVRHKHSAMILLLFPKSRLGLSTMSAKDWRRCLASGSDCHLEMTCGEAATVSVISGELGSDFSYMSYPLSNEMKLPLREIDFTNREGYEKRIL